MADEMKTCPDCAEEVKDEADICRHCGHAFDGGREWRYQQSRRRWINALVVVVVLVGVVVFMAREVDQSHKKADAASSASARAGSTATKGCGRPR